MNFLKNSDKVFPQNIIPIYTPYLLDDKSKDLPIKLRIKFQYEKEIHIYGFEYSKTAIISEFLYESVEKQLKIGKKFC